MQQQGEPSTIRENDLDDKSDAVTEPEFVQVSTGGKSLPHNQDKSLNLRPRGCKGAITHFTEDMGIPSDKAKKRKADDAALFLKGSIEPVVALESNGERRRLTDVEQPEGLPAGGSNLERALS
ncbi:MAG: hypothetical protein M1816_003928 [Peltula sp. TS41687]|nr:MAG: hypothetical protein M1816_003928 [Peltula sp. TS41687]